MLSPPKQYLIWFITAPEFNLEFLWGLSFIFITLSVLCFIGIFFIRNKIGSTTGRSKEKKMDFSPMISEFLFFEDTNDKAEKKNYLNLKVQIREQIKNSFDRSVFTEVLLDLRKDLSGQSQEVLTDLYRDLGLHNDAFEKLGSRRWQIISKGILELTIMDVKESYGLIVKFINHRNGTIRKQAEIAIVNLKEEGIAYFLDNTRYKISEWQQLKLLDVLRHKENFEPPKFSLWLTSNNTHVVLFALRLIKYFNQTDAEQSIITLLKHRKRDIQVEAIDCIEEFYFVAAIPTLQLVYYKAATDVKIAILNAIGEIGTEQEIEFLKSARKKERNFIIRSKVLGVLNKISPESIMPFKNIRAEGHFTTIPDDVTLDDEKSTDALEENYINEMPLVLNDILENDQSLPKDIPISSTIKEEVPINVSDMETTFKEVMYNEESSSTEVAEHTALISPITEALFDNKRKEESELSFDFTPLVINEHFKVKSETAEIFIAFQPLFDVDVSIPLDNSGTHNKTNTLQSIGEIDWATLFNEDVTEKFVEVALMENNPLAPKKHDSVSRSANFLEEDELRTMVLLEHIADLGDRRELPVLYELLEDNSSELILERTNELIYKFSYQSPRPNELFKTDNDLSSSVFKTILNLSDVETKLILLKEINAIGDEREIPVLRTLLTDENKHIAKSAKRVLEQLQNNIEDKEPKAHFTNEGTTFKEGFELKLEQNRGCTKIVEGLTLFDNLCSASTNLYKKLNG